MKVYSLRTETLLPCTPEKAWSFFSDPANLSRITPAHMNFRILPESDSGEMFPGMVIHYKVSPLAGIPMRWTTEITHCDPGRSFVDEQRFGPYAFWHHRHEFIPHEGGVMMLDTVHYAIGMGWIGRLANHLMVRHELRKIFDHRAEVIGRLFGSEPADQSESKFVSPQPQ